MARIVMIHNEQDAASRDLLAELKQTYPDEVEVLDFMAVRSAIWFRGCPTVMLLPAGSSGYEGAAWKDEVDVTKAVVDAALASARVIHLSTSSASVPVGTGTATITAALTDLDGNAATMDGVTYVAGGQETQSADGSLQFSSATAGTFVIACRHPDAAEETITEVVS